MLHTSALLDSHTHCMKRVSFYIVIDRERGEGDELLIFSVCCRGGDDGQRERGLLTGGLGQGGIVAPVAARSILGGSSDHHKATTTGSSKAAAMKGGGGGQGLQHDNKRYLAAVSQDKHLDLPVRSIP